LFIAVLAALVFPPVVHIPSASAASPMLPDLRMAKVSKVMIDTTTISGHRLLRYTATIVNVGAGPFETTGTRASTNESTMPLTQNIYQSDGSIVILPTNDTMYFAGDGHNHWHVTDLEGGELTREDNGVMVGTSAKHGFHAADSSAWDLTLPGAPQTKVYLACSGSGCKSSALRVTEGVSVGWKDTYGFLVVDQWIDITDLNNGRYVLTLSADPHQFFDEADATNNTASATLSIGSDSVKILSRTGGV
jgi:lysyl oxidase